MFASPGLRCANHQRIRRDPHLELQSSFDPRPGLALYQCGGAAPTRGTTEATGGLQPNGYGIAFFSDGGIAEHPESQKWAYMGEGVSNNRAEYNAITAVLAHAELLGYQKTCVQTDNKLVVNQINCRWACRYPALKPLLAQVRKCKGSAIIAIEHLFTTNEFYGP